MPPGDDKDNCWYVVRAFLRFQLRFGACSFWPIAGHCKNKDSCAVALKQQNAVTIDLKLWHEIQREISERACPNCWIPVEQKHIDACFCDGHTAASLWSWTSASSESQVSLHCGLELLRGANSSPWLPDRGAPSRIKIALEQKLYFWVAGFIQYICFDKRSCWKQLGAEDLVVGTTFAYCVWLRSQAGHTVSFLRVVAVCTLRVALTSPQVTTWNQPEYNMRLKFCKNLGVEALANVQIVLTCLFKDWHLSTINPNFAGASLPCASCWWQGQLLICSRTPTAARPWHEVAFFAFRTYLKGWGGVGHVNVPCHLHRCWMLRYWRVGVGWGMLTFLVICTHVGCYVTEGLGWGGAC